MEGGITVQLLDRKLSDIHTYPNNPRKNDAAVDAVCESIRQCGYIAPIIVDEDGVILAGHTRYKALKKMGIDSAQIIVRDGLSDDQKRKYRLLDNKTAELSSWDIDLLAGEMDGLDFGDLALDWGLDKMEGIDLDDYDQEYSGESETVHCPKCGFVFEI